MSIEQVTPAEAVARGAFDALEIKNKRIARLEQMLTRHQFCRDGHCPECGAQYHKKDCALKLVLKEGRQ